MSASAPRLLHELSGHHTAATNDAIYLADAQAVVSTSDDKCVVLMRRTQKPDCNGQKEKISGSAHDLTTEWTSEDFGG